MIAAHSMRMPHRQAALAWCAREGRCLTPADRGWLEGFAKVCLTF